MGAEEKQLIISLLASTDQNPSNSVSRIAIYLVLEASVTQTL